MKNYSEYRSNVYSQNGEDGILKQILDRLALQRDGWCVDFGAWDGKHLSNTYLLVETCGYSAIYIEGDPIKFMDLAKTAKGIPTIYPIEQMVGIDSATGLDQILGTTAIPKNYALLSIDIDSWDLDIWVRHVNYRPAVVVIEVNSNIAPGIVQWNPGPGGASQGSSFSAALAVAEYKDYQLVAHTGNCIFVANEVIEKLEMPVLDLEFPERLFDWSYIELASRPSLRRSLKQGLARLRRQ